MLEKFIRDHIRQLISGSRNPPIAFLTPSGDRGLFGPDSMVWKVHADFISMIIGGLSSLTLQALHPQALAGVWDHSSFRQDLRGRLERTAFFIAATTYGSVLMANSAIERVNKIHQHITGIDEFGKPYHATDPHLLAWVHLTETASFLNAYQNYRTPKLNAAEQDQYFKEMKILGERLGAVNLPSTAKESKEAIQSYLPELYYGQRAQSVVKLLDQFPTHPATKPFMKLISKAGFLNLPDWTYPILNEPTPSLAQRWAVTRSVKLLAIPVREALKDGVAAHAYRRVYGSHKRKA
ncbi:MAG: oxygenase MpaB family protein, partial [Betaproteobacteria bacterium]|jgi:uncharacterized protein (DUF2236 family)